MSSSCVYIACMKSHFNVKQKFLCALDRITLKNLNRQNYCHCHAFVVIIVLFAAATKNTFYTCDRVSMSTQCSAHMCMCNMNVQVCGCSAETFLDNFECLLF